MTGCMYLMVQLAVPTELSWQYLCCFLVIYDILEREIFLEDGEE